MTPASVFDILGPVMVGPSSSHTAGAVRIGRIARSILDEEVMRAEITLYGSFAKTFRGHGTDRALVGGLLNMDTDDGRIKDAFEVAKSQGLAFDFRLEFSEGPHPNTVGLLLTGKGGRQVFVEGSSVGGGNIIINRIGEFAVNVTVKFPTLLVEHLDKPGVIGRVATILGKNGINVGLMTVARHSSGIAKLMVAETDQEIPARLVSEIAGLPDIIKVMKFGPV